MRKPFYIVLMGIVLVACTRVAAPVESAVICLRCPQPLTRASDPDESLISDYNLLIFNSFGMLEEKVYVPWRELGHREQAVYYRTRLLKDVPYTILAAANLGYELPCRTLEEAMAYRYHMAYPDEFSQGIPMAAPLEDVVIGKRNVLELPMERLMARIDLSIDRRALDADVTFTVTSVRVGGCPSSALLFATSKAENAGQIFTVGYTKGDVQVDALNADITLGQSGEVPLYLLENAQGDLLDNIQNDRDKVFSEGRYREVCSYIEIHADYHSPSWHTRPGESLVYRFYLGEDRNNFDVFRNTRYHIAVRPEGTGLGEDSWRVQR